MDKFLQPTIAPVGGFDFVDPDDGFEYKGPYKSFAELETHVQEYRRQNGHPRIEKFRAVWEHYKCQDPRMKRYCCPVAKNIKRNFVQYWKGARSWIKAAIRGEAEFVGEFIARNRARQCEKCDLNKRDYGHSQAKLYADRFMIEQVGSRRVPNAKKLFSCDGCSCILSSKVWYSDESVAESLNESDVRKLKQARNVSGQPHKCWQLVSLEKIRGEKES